MSVGVKSPLGLQLHQRHKASCIPLGDVTPAALERLSVRFRQTVVRRFSRQVEPVRALS
jgi:hypothetical protein